MDGGDGGDADIDSGTLLELEIGPYSLAATHWNDYVLASDHGVPCPRVTPAAECVHAGAWRMIVLPTEDSCAGLVATDDGNWFEWSCSAIAGEVVITGRLRAEVGLTDLIDRDALEWRGITVTIARDGTAFARAERSALADDPVQALPVPQGGIIELDEPGVIYVMREIPEAVVRVAADQIAFLGRSDVDLNAPDLEVEPGVFFAWIEGLAFHLSDGEQTVELTGLSNSVVRDVTVIREEPFPIATTEVDLRIDAEQSTLAVLRSIGAAGTAIRVEGSHNVVRDVEVTGALGEGLVAHLVDSVISNVRVAQAGRSGVLLEGATGSTLENISVADCSQNGVLVDESSHNDTLVDVVATNNAFSGIVLRGSDHRLSLALTASNGLRGVIVQGMNVLLMHVTAANNFAAGLQVGISDTVTDEEGTPTEVVTTGAQIVNVISTQNAAGISLLSDSARTRVHDAWLATSPADVNLDGGHNIFSGVLAVGPAGSCRLNLMRPPVNAGLAAPCAIAGESTATLVIGNELTTYGFVLVAHQEWNDLRNAPVDSAGRRAYSQISDWFNFTHRHRHWGRHVYALGLPNPNARGRCTRGTEELPGYCAYWDWRVTTLDSSLARDPLAKHADGMTAALEEGVHVRTHVWSSTGEKSCAAIAGAAFDESTSQCTSRFVAYAYEPHGDGHGNDNLLCEPNERCVLNRNRGVYPGHGLLIAARGTDDHVEIPGFGAFTLEMFSENGP